MKKILSVLFALTLMANFALGQVQFDIPVSIQAGSTTQIIHLGVSGDGPGGAITDNTIGYDNGGAFGAYSEQLAPPAPPAPYDIDVRFLTPAGYTTTLPVGLGAGVTTDFRGFTSASQVDTFRIRVGSDDGNGAAFSPWTISWPANLNLYGTSWIIKPATGSDFAQTNMTSTTSLNFAPSGTSLFILVIKTGASQPSPGPNFVLNNSSLNFGTVNVGSSATQSVTVTNTGTTNALSITGVTPIAGYSVAANPAEAFPISVAPGGSKNFDVTFTPTAGGTAAGNIVFAHNASGGTTNLAVTGNGLSQGGNLNFAAASRVRFDNTNGYLDSLTLTTAGNPLKAIQFRIITNGLVIVRSVSRGSAIPAPAWNFSTVISRGAANVDGSSNDTIKVVILGNGTTSLPAGSYNNFLNFEYDAVNISEPDSQSAPISIQNLFSAQGDGSPAGIVAGPNTIVTLANRSMLGDINEDDRIDILDLLMIIDHILNRITLSGQEFTRADVAPWGAPDGVVDVLDLALLQNIILNGQYPNGVRIQKTSSTPVLAVVNNGLAKSDAVSSVRVTYHITESGIAVRLENKVAVKGLQIDFKNVKGSEISKVTSAFGAGQYKMENGNLRLLVYSQDGVSLDPGAHLLASVPFTLSNPNEVVALGLTLAGKDNAEIKDVDVEISHEAAPELPTVFALKQNFPNPFNPTTTIQFAVPAESNVRISIFNMLGQEVRTLVNEHKAQGTFAAQWDGKNDAGKLVATGAYIYRMSAGKFVETKKMMLLK